MAEERSLDEILESLEQAEKEFEQKWQELDLDGQNQKEQ